MLMPFFLLHPQAILPPCPGPGLESGQLGYAEACVWHRDVPTESRTAVKGQWEDHGPVPCL